MSDDRSLVGRKIVAVHLIVDVVFMAWGGFGLYEGIETGSTGAMIFGGVMLAIGTIDFIVIRAKHGH